MTPPKQGGDAGATLTAREARLRAEVHELEAGLTLTRAEVGHWQAEAERLQDALRHILALMGLQGARREDRQRHRVHLLRGVGPLMTPPREGGIT